MIAKNTTSIFTDETLVLAISLRVQDPEAMHRRLFVALALFTSACTFDNSNTVGDSGVGQADASTADASVDASVDAAVDAAVDGPLANLTPTITTIANQATHNALVGPISFSVADADDEVATLVVTATSSDQGVVLDGDIVIGGTGANRSVTLMPIFASTGSVTITLQVTDGNSVAISEFNVGLANSVPVAAADNFGAYGNTELDVAAGLGLLVNDSDADGDDLVVVVDTVTSVMGGAVSISADGSFLYLPPVGIVNASDSFEYQVYDGFENTIGTATVVIADSELVWYVDNSVLATGDGRSSLPFKSLTEAETASVAGDVIFVFEGNGTSSDMNAGIVLKDNQRLLGETAGLTLAGQQVIAVPATPRSPTLTNTAGDGITLASNSIVRGLTVEDTTGIGITGVDISVVEISEVQVLRTVGDGIDIKADPSASSTLAIANVVVEGNGNDFTTVPIGIDVRVSGNGGGRLVSTITNTQVNGTVTGVRVRARGNTGTGVLGGNSFVMSNLGVDRVDDDGVVLEVDATSINSFSITGATINGRNGVNNATPNRGLYLAYKAGTGSATSLSITNSTLTNVGGIGVDLSATGGSNAGTLTVLLRNNNISACAGRALSLSPDDDVSFVATIDNNTMTSNGSRTEFFFGTGTTHRIDLNLLNNEDDQGFSLTRDDVGVLNLGGDIGQGSSFDDDNGNIEDRGNTTNSGAPNLNFPTTGGVPLQINIVNPATIPEPA